MSRSKRLAFVFPALLLATPVLAHETLVKTVAQANAPIRYVTLDRMIREFAARALHESHAAREAKRPAVLAQR